MKKIGLLLMTLVLTVVFVNAQPGGQQSTPEERAKRQVEQLTTALGLDKAQVTKVEAIVLKYGKQQSELRQSMGQDGDRTVMMEKMTAMRAEQTKEIKALLTKEQVEKYDKYLAEQQARRGQGGGGGPRPNN